MNGDTEGVTGTTAGTQTAGLPADQKPSTQQTQGAGGQQADGEKLFNQADIDHIIADRLSRVNSKFADYDVLKDKAGKWEKHEEAQKTEEEKTKERIAALEKERDAALAMANERLIRAAFVTEAAKARAAHPEDVFALADLSDVKIDEKGNVKGVLEAVRAVVDAGRVPLMPDGNGTDKDKPKAAKLDGGAGAGSRTGEKDVALTDEELKMAQRLNISAEKYAAQRKQIAAKRQ